VGFGKKEDRTMMAKNSVIRGGSALFLAGALTLMGCAGGPLTTREKGAGIGALGGAAAGGLIGSAVGHPGAGAAIGGAVGLGTGAVIGDQMQRREYEDYYNR
jgi:phage tail tape-measure protein